MVYGVDKVVEGEVDGKEVGGERGDIAVRLERGLDHPVDGEDSERANAIATARQTQVIYR